MYLVYGSTAIKYWFDDFREPHDLDIITDEIQKNSKQIEYYWIPEFEYLKNNINKKYVDPDFLYTIKVSHAAWDIRFDKTMKDIIFLKSKGCKLDKEFYSKLYSRWEILHKEKKVKFTGSNELFFKENITRKYNHDELHEVFKFYEEPMHKKIRKDKDSPVCSEELWNNLSHDDKIKTVLEEAYVLATERYILKKIPPKHSKIKALKLLVTSASTGWFNLFIIENFKEIIEFSNEYFFEKINNLNILQ